MALQPEGPSQTRNAHIDPVNLLESSCIGKCRSPTPVNLRDPAGRVPL